jgi:hypothetical protein
MAAIPAEPDMSTAHATIVALIEAAAAGSELMGIFDRRLFALTAQRAPWKRPRPVLQPGSGVSMPADLRRLSLRAIGRAFFDRLRCSRSKPYRIVFNHTERDP